MASGWGPLACVATVLLFLSGAAWPSNQANTISSTAQALADRGVAKYEGFDPASASLKLVQVVFRHGARTPLNTIYTIQGAKWANCSEHYPGVEVKLHDENGAPKPPPILDTDTPELPGGCKQGTLTTAGYGLALHLGSWLRKRYVEGSETPSAEPKTGGFLPDLTPADVATDAASGADARGAAGGVAGAAAVSSSLDPAIATLRTTAIRRTVATLRGVLTGLWPGLDSEAAEPLPVGASVEPLEIMYGNNRTCARLGPLQEAMARDLNASDARDAELPRLTRLVADALGLDVPEGGAINWPKLYDILAAMVAEGLPLPPGASREVLDIVWAQAERHEASIIGPSPDLCASLGPGGDGAVGEGGGVEGLGSAGSGEESSSARRRRCHQVLRLGIGLLVRRLLGNMEARVEAEAVRAREAGNAGEVVGWRRDDGSSHHRGLMQAKQQQQQHHQHFEQQRDQLSRVEETEQQLQTPSKLYLFSGHDSSVTPLLAVLGQPALAWPPFTANVVFELWQAGRGTGQKSAVKEDKGGSSSSSRRFKEETVAVATGAGATGRRGLAGWRAEDREAANAISVSKEAHGAALATVARGGDAFWVRILYNGKPLVVPALSDAGGWVPLGYLRQRVLLPYSIGPSEHAEVCSREDIHDLDAVQPPSGDWETRGTMMERAGEAAQRARERMMTRHGML